MSNTTIGQKIVHLESVDSTNNYAANVFKEGRIDHGTVILADIQTNGRGQRGNTWQSDAFENLTMSIAIDPNLCKINNLISLNHITTIALYQLIKKYCQHVKIKWPNDILVNQNKIAGILIESQFSGNKMYSIIGVGLNVNQTYFESSKSTSLSIETNKNLNIKSLLFEYISFFNESLDEYLKHGEKHVHNLFDQQLWFKGTETQFIFNDKIFNGIIKNTDTNGQIRIEVDGALRLFKNGEIKYIQRLLD
ncbi:MAG: biotin--[acetyl-CoA-carboxylase] ligase [Fluviicola sp.]|nr:MAG: biotin--[acetyl-CoA-carboxylase] ligase [Fluviicola sp.]